MGMITDKGLSKKPSGKDVWLSDHAPKGHGRFVARITITGKRLFYFRYTDPSRKSVLVLIDKYDQKGKNGLTLEEARAKARELSDTYRDGKVDLKGHIESEHRIAKAGREAEELRLASDKALIQARSTVGELFDVWQQDLKRKDGGAEIRRQFDKDVLPRLRNVAVVDVKREMVAAVLDDVARRGAPNVARNLLGEIRQLFNYAIKRGYLEINPTAVLERNDYGKKVERDRVLKEPEIKLLPTMLASANLQDESIAAIWIMLSTACRVGEITRARWEHIDLDAGTWRIPPENSKNTRALVVSLSDFAVKSFRALQQSAPDCIPSPWVLPARRQIKREGMPVDTHVDLKSLTKQITDRQRGDKQSMSKRTSATASLIMPEGKWTAHDLRRTAATVMGSLGVQPVVIECCLNHVEQNRVKRIYQRHDYEAEMKDAWRLLGDRLDLLTRADVDNVISGNFGKAA